MCLRHGMVELHVIHDLPPNPARGTASRRRLVRHFTGMTPEDKPQRSRLVYTNLHRLRQMENTGARGRGMDFSPKAAGFVRKEKGFLNRRGRFSAPLLSVSWFLAWHMP